MWAHAIFLLALCRALCLANTDVIHLDMSPVRGSTSSVTPVYPTRPLPPGISPEEVPDVFCTDGQSPNDFFCDMRRVYGSDKWEPELAPNVQELDLEYPDTRRKGVTCTASFQKTDDNLTDGTMLRLPFSSFDCNGGEGPETGLPPFRMSTVTTLTVMASYDDLCRFVFQNAGSEGQTNGTNVLKFHYLQHTCIAPVSIGREVTDESSGPICGRRCRPVDK